MKHFSAELVQGVDVNTGDIVIDTGDSLQIEATGAELVATDGTRAIIIDNGDATQYISGTGTLLSNDAFNGGTFTASTGVLSLTRIDGTTALDLTIPTGAFNDTAGIIPVGVTGAGAFTGAAEDFADSSLSQAAAGGLVTAANGLASTTGDITAVAGNISATAGNVSAGGNVVAGTNLQVLGTTMLGDAGGDTVTVADLAEGFQGVVLASSTGVLSSVDTIPEALLPNIAIGDVFTFSTATADKTTAEGEFYANQTHDPDAPFHKGDIAIISYDTGNVTQTAVLIYVGDNQADATNGSYAVSTADDWHDISITAQGIMSVSGDGATINVTAGNTPVVSALTGAITATTDVALTTGGQVFDFVTARSVELIGTDVQAPAVTISSTGATQLTPVLQDNSVDIAEINTAAVTASDAGRVLTLNSTADGLEWTVNGSVGKATMSFSTPSQAIDISGLNTDDVVVAVYEVSGTTRTQVIPNSVVIDTAADTVTIDMVIAGSYHAVITG